MPLITQDTQLYECRMLGLALNFLDLFFFLCSFFAYLNKLVFFKDI